MKHIKFNGKFITIKDDDNYMMRININSIDAYGIDTELEDDHNIDFYVLLGHEFAKINTWYFTKLQDCKDAIVEIDTVMGDYFSKSKPKMVKDTKTQENQ